MLFLPVLLPHFSPLIFCLALRVKLMHLSLSHMGDFDISEKVDGEIPIQINRGLIIGLCNILGKTKAKAREGSILNMKLLISMF